MAGRNAKPLMLIQGHRTNAEKEHRKKTEVKFGESKLTCPAFIKSDKVAYAKWREMMRLYKDVDFVASGDIGTLARYCKTFSEYQDLLNAQQRIKEIHYDCEDLNEYIDDAIYDEDCERDKYLFSSKIKKQLRDLFSIHGILIIETAINKKMDMLIKMEDRLFLNPLAKIKNVPKTPKEEADDDPLAKMAARGRPNVQ